MTSGSRTRPGHSDSLSSRRADPSHPDRVPDGLHLEEGGDPLGSLGGAVVEPVEAIRGAGATGRPSDALHVLHGEILGLLLELRRDTPGGEGVDVHVTGKYGDELSGEAGQ